ncbi:MAG TPA: class I SAM-dependent methyltransferase [Gemmatimonadales bacterium]|nr:class I SAM-dependent methyltransferase [Gemmatimonadales bacterium]
MTTLPRDFTASCDDAWRRVQAAPGFLTEREARFLALVAAVTPAAGTILEIGSFKGKSTVGLASIVAQYGLGRVVAVDPFTAPASTDPGLGGAASSYDEFCRTVNAAGLTAYVEVHRMFSRDLARGWHRPIRFLWIDGDHTYEGVKEDIDLFGPHLADGAVVAMHDVLHTFPGPVRVFLEDVLRSDRFGPVGCCGSIGWAQYRPKDGAAPGFRVRRRALARRIEPLAAISARGREPSGIAKLRYQWYRASVPHGAVDPAAWAAQVTLPAGAGPT